MSSSLQTLECKIVLVGGVNTGKTCMIKKFCFDVFDADNKEVTIGAEISSREIALNNKVILKYNLWDTAGQEQYRTLNRIFYANAKIIALIYDITNQESFNEIKDYWYKQVMSYCDKNADKMEDGTIKEMPCKMILLGDVQVGKTAFYNKITIGNFNPNEMSTQTNTNRKKYFNINNKSICVDLWDTAGQEKFQSLNKLFFSGSDVVLLLFDITNKTSFTNIQNNWMPLIQNNCPSDIVIGIAGNKFDLFEEQEVTEEELQKYANKINAEFAFISCLQNLGLDDLIVKLLEKFIVVYKEKHPIIIKEEAPKKKSCCKK